MDKTIELYEYKNDYLRYKEDYEEINLDAFLELIFYNEDFPFEDVLCDEYLRWRDDKEYQSGRVFKYNALVLHEQYRRNGEGTFNGFSLILKDDEERKNRLRGCKFAIMSPITYVGKRACYENARFLYAIAFDLDGVGEGEIADIFHQIGQKDMRVTLPRPNIIVNSGNGLHLYYLLDKPIPMYKEYVKIISRLKYDLTYKIWNEYTSSYKARQVQGIVQAFRLPESLTKFGKPVRAFYDSSVERYTISKLNEYNTFETRLTASEVETIEKNKRSDKGLSLEKAKEMYPEWYERKIVQGDKTSKRWHCNRGLYDWWHKRLLFPKNAKEIKEGHRYYCLLVLVSLARKCDVPFDELKKDAYELVPILELKTSREDNHFTKEDADSALQAYYKDYSKISVDTIERLTAMRVDRTRRNGRSMGEHLFRARAVRDAINPNWRKGNGRPKETPETSQYAKKISKWRSSNPQGNKSECARDLGYSRHTVHKWWD